jgi:D-alanine-D-alanine ligase
VRLGIIWERKSDYPFSPGDTEEFDSELFSHAEENALLSGLRDAGHEVIRIGDGVRLARRPGYWRRRCDLAFNLSVGYRGIDRKSLVPGVLELAGIPYVGSAPYALSLTRHKHHAKLVVGAAGVPTANSVLWTGPGTAGRLADLRYPVIVKPVAESSSIGIERGLSVVTSPEAAAERAESLRERFRQPALVEEFVEGTEIEVPVMGWPELRALGVVAITLGDQVVQGFGHLTSDSVYDDGYGFAPLPSHLDESRIKKAALVAADALGVRDYGRIDFRVSSDGTPFFLEASTHPHIQHHSSFFVLADGRGLAYHQMLDEILAVSRLRLKL